MGRKINPKALRINITDVWRSRWMSKFGYAKTLKEDVMLREYIIKNYRVAGIDRVEIERFNDQLTIIIKTTKPGILIGRAGGGIEDMKKKLKDQFKLSKNFKINIEEVKNIGLAAQVWANNAADQLEKRFPHRRILKQTLEQVMEAGAKGVRMAIKGRLGGAEIARTEKLYKGSLPLHTFRTHIDYGEATAFTTYGTIGIKVWINQGEVFKGVKPTDIRSSSEETSTK
ncbi:MAG: 30S ribosomal protein S3 [Candidatus Doudnabacteria bacterium RIFCSPHIGHO2_01_FULL_43_23]|uniref:Small ribosomal subunit protein uS3 n=1 Tax=Candidatus Doudnabacteria bacterium RIFCSPHIGHO2_01_FULL_43_23 TaxID=1817822 RepID=A0A1F5NVQ4_9BACT|nr:ribosomal protein S3 [uncultured bacterium]OGE81654.1 MAG: 30S ribosomal protein S3 [Candidatus Doudnabacteria bacterium RIFCSPHIGHO2_01_FULL_43_23]